MILLIYKETLKNIKGREKCLKLIIKHVYEIEKRDNKFEKRLEKLSELFTKLRIYSLNVVENIISWKSYLKHIYSNYKCYFNKGVELIFKYQK